MAKQGNANFEIPAEMRAFAEKSVEQARQAFDSFISAAHAAVSTADKQAAGARAGAQELGGLAVRFAERNIAASFAFAQQLVRAKDSAEVLALQADYLKSQMAALAEQAKELSKEAAKMTGQGGQHWAGRRRRGPEWK
jgi:phasin